MHKIEKKCLIDFFNTINTKFEYVVLRNADELPFDNFSNDIDILIDKFKYNIFEREMKIVFLRNGFEKIERTSFHGIECYTFYNIKNQVPYSLKIDLFFNIEGGGIRYYDFNDIIKFKIKNSNGVSVFDNKTESYLTAFKTLAAGGLLKEKYLRNYISNNIEDYKELLSKSPSKKITNYLKEILITKKNPMKTARRTILLQTFKSNFKKYGFFTFSIFLYHYKLEFKRAFSSDKSIIFKGVSNEVVIKYVNIIKQSARPVLRSNSNRIIFINDNKLNIFNFFKYYFIKIVPLQRGDKIIIYNESSFFATKSKKSINLNIEKEPSNILSIIIDNLADTLTP